MPDALSDLHVPTLLAAGAVLLLLSAGSTTFIALKQRTHRGYWWWAGANGLLVPALLVASGIVSVPFASAVASVLALPWPILVLAGMRRFYSRSSPGVPQGVDWALLGTACVATVIGASLPSMPALQSGVTVVGATVLGAYAAVLITRLEDFSVSAALKSLVAVLLLGAIGLGTWMVLIATGALSGLDPQQGSVMQLLATLFSAMLMTHLGLQLNQERTVDNLRSSLRRLRHIADVDPLTRLPNKRHFGELAERAISTLHASTATVVLFDVDNLKNINDLLGHATGDEALRQVGLAMRETLRRRDVAGRLGGDDFAALLLKTTADDARLAAARVMARLNDRQVAPRIARVTLNFGIAQLQVGETIGEALRRAETGLERKRDENRKRNSNAPTEQLPVRESAAPMPAVSSV